MTKVKLNINKLLTGTMDSSKKSYGMYVLSEASLKQTIGKIQSEMMERAGTIQNYVVFGKGKT